LQNAASSIAFAGCGARKDHPVFQILQRCM